jgi:ketosteroid isomerase-like protein
VRRLKLGLLALALLCLAAVGLSRGLLAKDEAHERDMAGIENLHRQDVAVTLAGDPKALAGLWTDDAVRMEPGGPAEVGKPVINSHDEKAKAEHPALQILTYAPEIKDVNVVDGWAFEWGYFSSSYRESPGGEVKSFRGKLLRVLRRQPDGSWKFARVMWNLAE